LLNYAAMDSSMITGAAILIVAMLFLFILVVWSLRIINKISRKGYHTSRETLKVLNSGR